MQKEPIKEWTGKIIGWLETDHDGTQIIKDFYGKILGKYDARLDETRDFYGRRVSKGNQVMRLLR